ncbi:MAG: tail fiber domain-containing protein [Bacteroidetes bacterium]|nr:tail fiber domain-containing protein [Bacteroidota bacterium]
MKKLLTIIPGVLLTAILWAQSPQKMSYQAVIRNVTNQLVTTQIGMKISILQGTENGTPVYVETQTPTPNANGLVTIEIGGGVTFTGTFATIDWSAGPYFIKTETAITAPLTTYTITGTSQLLSVPYALYSNASGGGWSITGNAGLIDGTNFIGTTDNVPFNIRVNNQKAGSIDPTLYNTFWGYQAGNSNTTGNSNTANGFNALFTNTTGNSNTAIGRYALFSNTTGILNTANGGGALYSNITGYNNTASGFKALYSNVAGNNGVAIGFYSQHFANNTATAYDNTNTSIGYQSLRGSDTPANNTGTDNTAIGRDALYNNSAGSRNTASGFDALYSNTTGHSNTAHGMNALYINTTGTYNTAIGVNALYSNTIGVSNTAIGLNALNYNTTGNHNTAIGLSALKSNVAGNNGVAIGFFSQYYANNTATDYDNSNTSVGYQSLRGSETPSANTGISNTAIGRDALYSNTSGNSNTAIGKGTLYSNTTGYQNTANGINALQFNTKGISNTAIGGGALQSNVAGSNGVAIGIYSQWFANNTEIAYDNTNTSLGYESLRGSLIPSDNTGTGNTAIGRDAIRTNTTGTFNTAIGLGALSTNTTGNDNTAIGHNALYNNTTGNQNTAIGKNALGSGEVYSNSTGIGYNAHVTASNMIKLGDYRVTSINGAVAFTVISDGRFKKDINENVSGLSFIMKLRPVTYHLDMDKIAVFMKTSDNSRDRASEASKEKVLQTGFIAQEVENVAQELGYDFSGIDKPDNENDYYGLRYAEFTVPLVKAVQEQQKVIETLIEEIRQLKEQANHKQSVLSKLEVENATIKSAFESRLKKLEEMLGLMAQK